MVSAVNAIILKTEKLEETYVFYLALDLPLEKEKHGTGPAHYACDLAGVHFAIYELDPWKGPERRSRSHDTMVGFAISDLDAALEKLKPLNTKIVIPPEQVPWGKRAVVMDPDGRPVELNQAD